ncbi:MAG: ImmA/IrrE family metallo-endopeptidase [Dehalococcoidia bacterium]
MPRKTPVVAVNPTVLEWARRASGFSQNDVARHLGLTSSQITMWNTNVPHVYLRVRQLQELADYFKRPLASLLLEKPPADLKLPHDYRRARAEYSALSPDLMLSIRRARRYQRIARELMDSAELSVTPMIPKVSINQKPEDVAYKQRKIFGINEREQFGWRDSRVAYRRWREMLETHNILVFQNDFLRDEAQGFSLSDNLPYVIMVSYKDSVNARCFTLFHELAHLLLNEGGLCITETAYAHRHDHSSDIENWCNRFAESFLVSESSLITRLETSAIINKEPGYEYSLRRLALVYKVSQSVILFRLWHTNLISEERFWDEFSIVQESLKEDASKEVKKEEQRGPSPAVMSVQNRGKFLTNLIIQSLDRQILGYSEAIDYLGIRLKHLDKVRMIVRGERA